ncbi:transmembrane protein, putative [Bodo saltans]|uniref:Transmembrane protein, putative n=1 Tax=Bodo saltans TaxID=75058 RepID=A0A0S4IS98_BODSA|nr:transmembrane protein, putative [Bodo saltans]|eukprot:CUF21069.1 transmembrane protein, putative [Bodo saltans]
MAPSSSMSPIHSPPPNSSNIGSTDVLSSVQSALASAVYTAALGGAGSLGRGAVPALQRAVASLRLAARCKATTNNSANGSSHDGDGKTEKQRKTTTRVSKLAIDALLLLASRLPGSLAVPYGMLLQPGIGACVALVVSSARTPASVACGVIVSIVWMMLPVYSLFAVVVRGTCS